MNKPQPKTHKLKHTITKKRSKKLSPRPKTINVNAWVVTTLILIPESTDRFKTGGNA